MICHLYLDFCDDHLYFSIQATEKYSNSNVLQCAVTFAATSLPHIQTSVIWEIQASTFTKFHLLLIPGLQPFKVKLTPAALFPGYQVALNGWIMCKFRATTWKHNWNQGKRRKCGLVILLKIGSVINTSINIANFNKSMHIGVSCHPKKVPRNEIWVRYLPHSDFPNLLKVVKRHNFFPL